MDQFLPSLRRKLVLTIKTSWNHASVVNIDRWVDRNSHEGSHGEKVLEGAQLLPFPSGMLDDQLVYA